MNETLVLDIGTGTVIGMVARRGEDGLEILGREERRHEDRVVREGRIVDVERAAETVSGVVEALSEQAGVRANTAHFAVPGRGLELSRPSHEIEFGSPRDITSEDWNRLIRERPRPEGQKVVVDTEVVRCEIDGEPVENPVGQFGRRLSAEWLLSTIPMHEIENKRNVLIEAGLVPGQVVLESRAALRASVSPDDFNASIGVIDFGAGTIDVAHLENGRVRDYATFLGSGDEITRRIERERHIGFQEAESIKSSADQDDVQYRTLSGDTAWISRDELEHMIIPVLKEQVTRLKNWFDDREPEIIFLAGGGSQFQFLDRLVSRILGIAEDNIVSGPPKLPANCVDDRRLVGSAADFTALGQLLLVDEGRARQYLRLTVNGDPFARLIDDDEFTVGDLCTELGYETRDPTPDSAKMISLDGEWETFRADHRLEPVVHVSGDQVDENHPLRSGDEVEIEPPEEPRPLRLEAVDCLPDEVLSVRYNGKHLELKPFLTDDDGTRLDDDEELTDGEAYRLHDRFSPEDVLRNVTEELGSSPAVPLWYIDGTYRQPETFTVGQTVRLEDGRSIDSAGLGQLESTPDDGGPIEFSLN